jgi:hypothetical protein
MRISETLLNAVGREPIRPAIHARSDHHSIAHHHRVAPRTHVHRAARAPTVDVLVSRVQREYPYAHIRVTGRGRTPRRQAELMAQRRRANRHQFLQTYVPAQHITEMD